MPFNWTLVIEKNSIVHKTKWTAPQTVQGIYYWFLGSAKKSKSLQCNNISGHRYCQLEISPHSEGELLFMCRSSNIFSNKIALARIKFEIMTFKWIICKKAQYYMGWPQKWKANGEKRKRKWFSPSSGGNPGHCSQLNTFFARLTLRGIQFFCCCWHLGKIKLDRTAKWVLTWLIAICWAVQRCPLKRVGVTTL